MLAGSFAIIRMQTRRMQCGNTDIRLDLIGRHRYCSDYGCCTFEIEIEVNQCMLVFRANMLQAPEQQGI